MAYVAVRNNKAAQPRRKIPIVGRRLIECFEEQLRHLRPDQNHGNRILFEDHIVVAHLIAFFDPAVDSLRRIEDVFESGRIRKRLAAC